MYVKVLIVYLVCFYVLNTVSFFKPLQQKLYSSFYVKDENNIRGLMYEPYDFSDVRNILLGILITPYGLSVCPVYTDCNGIEFGDSQYDCNGICGGESISGDVNLDSFLDISDMQIYASDIISSDWNAT